MQTIHYISKILRQLRNKFKGLNFREGLNMKGEFELIATDKDGKVLEHIKEENLILLNIKKKIIESLMTGTIDKVFRMAIGDDGTVTGDAFSPKVPDVEETSLYHEVYRKDIVWPPVIDTTGTKITFTGTFSSLDVPGTSWQNASAQRVNEAILVVGDGVLGGGDVAFPDPVDADESAAAKRCFKSVPFEAALDVTITIRWSFYIR